MTLIKITKNLSKQPKAVKSNQKHPILKTNIKTLTYFNSYKITLVS